MYIRWLFVFYFFGFFFSFTIIPEIMAFFKITSRPHSPWYIIVWEFIVVLALCLYQFFRVKKSLRNNGVAFRQFQDMTYDEKWQTFDRLGIPRNSIAMQVAEKDM